MIEESDGSARTKEIRRTRFLLTLPLFAVLLSLVLVSSVLYIAHLKGDAEVFPLVLVLIGIVIIFFGAFFDFGANRYLENVFLAKAPLKERDITQINREQLIMTVIYGGIGLLYILIGVIMSFIFTAV
jgi:hypothetical protein